MVSTTETMVLYAGQLTDEGLDEAGSQLDASFGPTMGANPSTWLDAATGAGLTFLPMMVDMRDDVELGAVTAGTGRLAELTVNGVMQLFQGMSGNSSSSSAAQSVSARTVRMQQGRSTAGSTSGGVEITG